jgi:hypothetical protein
VNMTEAQGGRLPSGASRREAVVLTAGSWFIRSAR